MTVEGELEKLVRFCEHNVYPRTFRKVVVEGLQFFHAQARSDDRLNPESMKLKWMEFTEALRGTGILDRLIKESNNWSLVEHFVQGQETLNVRSLEIQRSPYAKWDVDQLFRHLLETVQGGQHFHGLERFAIMIGLKYLLSEKEKAAHRRESKWIGPAWKFIQPLLRREGLLDPFDEEQSLKDRLKHFVHG